MKTFFRSFWLLFLLPLLLPAQDFKNVMEALQKVETNLRTLIEDERAARKSENAAILAKLAQIGGGKSEAVKSAPESKNSHSTEFAPLIKRLQEGNLRYVKNDPAPKNVKILRSALVKGQKPFVTVLTCSDSRVPPEMIFDESLGQVFVIRVAGNVADSAGIGSIEYAAEHLHTGLLLVLGHESCGAVKATIEGGEVPPNIGSLVWRLQPAVREAKAKGLKEKELLSSAVEQNVQQQIAWIMGNSAVIAKMADEGEVKVIGGIYDLETGAVRFLDTKETAVR